MTLCLSASPSMPVYDVLVVGSCSVDLIFSGLPQLPELGREVVGRGFAMIPGEAYNSAVAMHRLGLRVAWAGDFGNDEFSQFALRAAREEGLDETFFVHHARPLRRLTVAVSFPEDRAFITYYDPDPLIPAGLRALRKVCARLLFVPGFYAGPLFHLGLFWVRAKGMKVAMDGNSHPDMHLKRAAVRRAIRSLDLFLPNAAEALHLTGESDLPRAIRRLGELCPLVVVKAGAEGAFAYHRQQLIHVPALKIKPLDTTGAGDCFNAGFVRAWLDGRPLEECLRWGNIVGGLSTLGYGATGRKVTLAEVQRYLRRSNSQAAKDGPEPVVEPTTPKVES
ncbi:MAG: carbohydrate kinase family protein [Anaerolineales bacterium]|nr:carbohydrate kinase family protein [Anaerolineales bacterium]MCS7248909.1 carbohydrate kinase family protein [Anaerolineales bacterium]MDW8162722.1 carbohydrate kinase family protein [Anaerolineales bacterium]MDW8447124.1 carbohydrate kinase family protein [Anaerolineales bacterium]